MADSRAQPLHGRRVVLGVSGGIAVYKAAELTRLLMAEHGTAHVLDVRRPKSDNGGARGGDRWSAGGLLGLTAALMLVFD